VIQARLAWSSFKTMLRTAAHDPVWAVSAIVVSPIRFGRYIIGALLVLCVSGLLLTWLFHAFLPESLFTVSDVAVSLFLMTMIFRMATGPMINRFGASEDDTHGTARFATEPEVAPLTRRSYDGLLIGRSLNGKKLLSYDGPSHLLTIAPTRTGKGVGTVIPNLLTARRSVICIDPKGENTLITGRARSKLGPVDVLDPFEVTGIPTSAFNPLDLLDPASLDVAEDAATLADALVYDPPGEAGEAHWNEEAKALIAGVLLHVVSSEPPDRRTLMTLREHLTSPPDAFEALLADMQASPAAGGLVARAANRHLGKSDREATGVLSSAQRHTHFLDSPRMAMVLEASDFKFSDLRARIGTVFLVLPPDRIATYARWLRLMVTQSLQASVRARAAAQTSVLYLLDEFASLGYLPALERAMGLMAGYGVQLWPILQDIHQLRATYGERAGTFLSNAGVFQVFGVNDHDCARLVSDLLGSETVVFSTASHALDSDRSGLSYAAHHTARPLLTPDEVRNLSPDMELLFLSGQRPILAKKLRYFSDTEFASQFD
jgi:type IV secretion system protein VirD4